MLFSPSFALIQLRLTPDQPFGVPVWLPILIFLILIFAVLWLTYSFQEEKPEYQPPWAILPSIDTPQSQTHSPLGEHDLGIPSQNVIEAPASASTIAPDQPIPSPAVPAVDDLERIEGIGPVIARLLVSNGITTFLDLASTDLAKLSSILSAANLRIADPGSWSEQAGLAAAGKWEELEKLQEKLKAGKYLNP